MSSTKITQLSLHWGCGGMLGWRAVITGKQQQHHHNTLEHRNRHVSYRQQHKGPSRKRGPITTIRKGNSPPAWELNVPVLLCRLSDEYVHAIFSP